MKHYTKHILLLALSIFPLSFLLGQNQTKELETVVITATRTPKLLKNVPIITQIISTEQIRRSDANNIEELMTSILPGLEFAFAVNQERILNFQGFGGNRVLFLIDGNRIAGETMDNPDYSRLNLDNVERIEIVKGAASTLYGSQAMGAVINIITKKAKEGVHANINGRWGAYKNHRYGASLNIKHGNLSSMTSAQYSGIDEIKTPNIGSYQKIYGFSTQSLKHSLNLDLTKNIQLHAGGSYFKRQLRHQAELHNNYYGYNANFGFKLKFGKGQSLNLSTTYDRYDKTELSLPKKQETTNYINKQESLRLLYTNNIKPNMTLIVGGDMMRDYLLSYQFKNKGSHTQYSGDIFTQFDYDVLPKLNIISALRYDYFSATKNQQVSPKLSLMYKLLPYLRLRSSYSMGFRSPTLKENYMLFNMANTVMIYGNEQLKGESSHNIQLSTEYAQGNYNACLLANHSILKDRISVLFNKDKAGLHPNQKGAYQYQNIDKMRITSLEASLSARYSWGLSARLSYIFTYEHDYSEDQGVKISLTRPHTANLHIDFARNWQYYSFSLSLNGRYLSDVSTKQMVKNFKTRKEEQVIHTYPAYQLWDLNLRQRVYKGVHLSFKVDNLFNYIPDFYSNNAPPTVGRTYICGISLDLDQLH